MVMLGGLNKLSSIITITSNQFDNEYGIIIDDDSTEYGVHTTTCCTEYTHISAVNII